jgi:hypothetical protein
MRILFTRYFGDLKLLVFERTITVIFLSLYHIYESYIFRKLRNVVGFESKFNAVFGTGDDVLPPFNLSHHGIDATFAVGVSAGSE